MALKNTYDHLQIGGTFRLVLPDLEQLARSYLTRNSDTASIWFMEESCLGERKRTRGLSSLIKDRFGNSRHLWMWDEKSIASKLRDLGFKNIRRANYGDAEDPRFNEVEEKDRFDGCLAMQCQK